MSGKLRVEKVWAQLTNPRDQLSHQIGLFVDLLHAPFFFLFCRHRCKTCVKQQIGHCILYDSERSTKVGSEMYVMMKKDWLVEQLLSPWTS